MHCETVKFVNMIPFDSYWYPTHWEQMHFP